MLSQDHVFQRTIAEGSEISAHLYHFMIGLTLLWGFGVNYYLIQSDALLAWTMNIGPWIILMGYFISMIFGTVLYSVSSNPVLSFIGYNLIVVPMGVVISPFVNSVNPALVSEAIVLTGGLTGCMMVVSTIFPAFFLSIGRTLFLVLLLAIIGEVVSIFVFHKQHDVFDWIFVLIFCGYIGFDWARASVIPKTVDNAIDSAAAIYVDIINLFIRILSILGERD
jgi:FtsH-binding integral membrane protein